MRLPLVRHREVGSRGDRLGGVVVAAAVPGHDSSGLRGTVQGQAPGVGVGGGAQNVRHLPRDLADRG